MSGTGPSENRWLASVRENPNKATEYAERWRRIEAEGNDIFGEARLADALVPRGSRILDAGCGTGRIAGYLHGAGHEVWGVDLDPTLIEFARADYPGPTWQVQNLAELSLVDTAGARIEFDLILSAGNVMGFLADAERGAALRGIFAHLAPKGRAVIGFGSGWGWDFGEFIDAAYAAGLELQARFSTWELHPPNDDFFVGVFGRR